MQSPELSVIVATLNEEANIENCVRRIFAVFPNDCEVLVVDGGHDRTPEIVAQLSSEFSGLRYVRNEDDRGKGHATQRGIDEAKADIMVEIDADLQFLPEELPMLIEPILAGRADVCLGSRFARQSTRNYGHLLRSFGNRVTSIYASILFFHWMTDVLAGMTAWTRQTSDKIGHISENYSYEVEIPVKALKNGLRVVDVPITTDPRTAGDSSVKVVRDGLSILWDITRFRCGLK